MSSRISSATLQRVQSLSALTLVASMGAVGNILGVVAISLGRIPTPAVNQVAFDFSSLAVVIVAIFAGWRLGALTGLIAGLGPMVLFGWVYGNTGIITVLLPVGKALTGLSVGLISDSVRSVQKFRTPLVLASIWIGFVPEAVMTWFYFVNIVPFFLPGAYAGPTVATLVLVKGWAEMIIIAFLAVALFGNPGFKSFLGRLFQAQNVETETI